MIDLIIGMTVLGVALLFAWSLGYKMGYDRGIYDEQSGFNINNCEKNRKESL